MLSAGNLNIRKIREWLELHKMLLALLVKNALSKFKKLLVNNLPEFFFKDFREKLDRQTETQKDQQFGEHLERHLIRFC